MFDQNGYVRDFSSWNASLAEKIAQQEGIILSDQHWQVINALRKYYAVQKVSPVTRILVKYLAEEFGVDKFNSGTLNLLFNGKPAKLAAKIAGLPKPKNCI